jgi:hypothetical protein
MQCYSVRVRFRICCPGSVFGGGGRVLGVHHYYDGDDELQDHHDGV